MSIFESALRHLTMSGLQLRNRHHPPPALLHMYVKSPLLLGHRGARDHAVENTLDAFGLAISFGADGVELDVRLSADGIPVVVHDETVDRTMVGLGRVCEMTAEELTHLQPRGRGEQAAQPPEDATAPSYSRGVPTLAAVLEQMPRGTVVNIEMKGPTARADGLERRVVEVIALHRERLRLLVSSFHPAQLLYLRELDASIPIGLLVEPEQNAWLRSGFAALALRPEAFHPPSQMVTRDLVKRAHATGMRVHAWGVRDADDADRLLECGVDALIVDDVPAVAARLGRRLRSTVSSRPGS